MDGSAFNYILNQKISVFYGRKDPVPKHDVSVKSILKAIKDGKWKDLIEWLAQETDEDERAEIKGKFPAVTFSGTFSHRAASKIISYTHLLVIDLDKKHIDIPYDKAFEYVTSCPFVFAAFKSPSGGIKALAYSRLKVEKHKDLFFPCVEDYFIRNFGLRMDASGKDVSRLCFISYDPDMYLSAEGKRPFSPKEDASELFKAITNPFREIHDIDFDRYQESTDIRHVFKLARKWAEKSTGGFKKGSRNNYIYYLACILNRAGIYETTTFEVLTGRYPSLGIDELKTTVKSAYSHHRNEFGIRPILQQKKTDQKSML